MIQAVDEPGGLSFWQLVFSRSKVNGAPYDGEEPQRYKWEWPKDTYFQRRLHYLRECQIAGVIPSKLSPEARYEVLYKQLLRKYRDN